MGMEGEDGVCTARGEASGRPSPVHTLITDPQPPGLGGIHVYPLRPLGLGHFVAVARTCSYKHPCRDTALLVDKTVCPPAAQIPEGPGRVMRGGTQVTYVLPSCPGRSWGWGGFVKGTTTLWDGLVWERHVGKGVMETRRDRGALTPWRLQKSTLLLLFDPGVQVGPFSALSRSPEAISCPPASF